MSLFEPGQDPVQEIYTWTQNLCKRVARQGWNIQRYNNGNPWDDDSIMELCHETFELLLADNNARLDAILDASDNSNEIRKKLAYEVRNCLQRREEHQPFNNLIKRIRKLAKDGHFSITKVKGVGEYVSQPGSEVQYRQLTDAEIHGCARRCEDIPVIYSTRTPTVAINADGKQQRRQSSPMYVTEDLIEVVNRILKTAGTVDTVGLRKIFDLLLTPWSRNLDVPFEEDQQSDPVTYDTDENDLDDRNHHRDNPMHQLLENLELEFPNTIAIVNTLTEEEVFLLLCIGSNISFVNIGDHLGITRQTASKRVELPAAKLATALRADEQHTTHSVELVRTLLIQRLATTFATELTIEQCKIWVHLVNKAHSALANLVERSETDIGLAVQELKHRFNSRMLFALQQQDPEVTEYEQKLALSETRNACAERVPE